MRLPNAYGPIVLLAGLMTLIAAANPLSAPETPASTRAVAPLMIEYTATDITDVNIDAGSTGPAFSAPLSNYRLSSAFGERVHPIRHTHHRHSGADMAAPRGTPVRTIADGTVEAIIRMSRGYGRYVVIQHDHGYSSWYAHLDSVDKELAVGEQVPAGEVIGTVGSSGAATGPHLHLEIRHDGVPQEPLGLLSWPLEGVPIGIAPAWRANAAPP